MCDFYETFISVQATTILSEHLCLEISKYHGNRYKNVRSIENTTGFHYG